MIGLLGGLLLLGAPGVEIRSAGVGGYHLPGPVPVLVRVTGDGETTTAGSLVLEYTGLDGDTVQYASNVPVVGTAATDHWVLVDPPHRDTLLGARLLDEAGDQLAASEPVALATLAKPVDRLPGAFATAELVAIVGTDRLGLEGLQVALTEQVMRRRLLPITMTADALPPLPAALRGLHAIIWSGGGAPDEALTDALLQWVHESGHLILTPPAMGPPWGQAGNPLAIRVGLETPAPAEGITTDMLSPFFEQPLQGDPPMLVRLPTDTPWRMVTPLHEDHALITRASLGHGHVTAVAMDPSRRALATLEGPDGGALRPSLPAFWGPALARHDLPSMSALRRAASEDRMRLNLSPAPSQVMQGGHVAAALRRDLTVGGRLLSAVVLAVLYLLSATVLLGTLTRRRRAWIVWPSFAAMSVVFALVTWAAGELLLPTHSQVQHLTVLDQVHGQPVQKATAYLELQLPGTGDRLVTVRDDATETARIEPWDPRADGIDVTFGDVRRLPERTHDDAMWMLARDTTARAQVHWTGTANPERWGRVFTPASGEPESIRPDGTAGALDYRLPVPLHEATMLLLSDLPPTPGQGGAWIKADTAGHPLVRGWWLGLGTINPGDRIVLNTLTKSPAADLMTVKHQSVAKQAAWTTDANAGLFWAALSTASLAPTPPWSMRFPKDTEHKWQRDANKMPIWGQIETLFGDHLDLGPWLAGPAVIIMGWVDQAELPIPLQINGADPDAVDGRTFVRWIMPLDGDTVGDDS